MGPLEADSLCRKNPIEYIFHMDELSDEARVDMSRYMSAVKHCQRCPIGWADNVPRTPALTIGGSEFLFIGPTPRYLVNENDIEILKRYRKGLGITEYAYINMNCCVPPQNHTPTIEEVEACKVYRPVELSLIGDNLRYIFPMGNAALYWILGSNSKSIDSMWGTEIKYTENGREISVIPLPSPSDLMRNPDMQKGIRSVLADARKLIERHAMATA